MIEGGNDYAQAHHSASLNKVSMRERERIYVGETHSAIGGEPHCEENIK